MILVDLQSERFGAPQADVVHAGVQASDVPLAAPAATATAQKSADATEEALRRKVEDLKRDGATVESASTEITTGWSGLPDHRIRPRHRR
jgi:hypothetical protein